MIRFLTKNKVKQAIEMLEEGTEDSETQSLVTTGISFLKSKQLIFSDDKKHNVGVYYYVKVLQIFLF